MRRIPGGVLLLLQLLILMGALLSGCIESDDGLDPQGEPAIEEEEAAGLEGHYTLPLTDTTWDHTDLIVLIVPPLYGQIGEIDEVNPYDGTYLRAVEDSIAHWQQTIDEHGSEDVRQIELRTYVLGRDIPPIDVHEVDILVVNPPKAPLVAPFSGVGVGLPTAKCLVYNSIEPLVDEYDWIFALAGHEFGHCLGLGHPEEHDPWLDLMSYTDIYIPDGEEMPPLECVSNMNLVGLHETFGPAFGREAKGPIEFPKQDYEIYECWDEYLSD